MIFQQETVNIYSLFTKSEIFGEYPEYPSQNLVSSKHPDSFIQEAKGDVSGSLTAENRN